MKRKDFRETLKRYQAGCASEEEIQIVEKWFDAMGMQQSDITDMDEAMLERQYWSAIMKQVSKTRVHTLKTHRTRAYRYVTGIAATFLLVAVSLFLIIDKKPDQQGQRTTAENNAVTWTHLTNVDSKSLRHSLPDGSTVTLKPQSTIRYSSLFNMSVREVYLEGEGFFEVTKDKDKPFLVYANEITTRVLGTSFIVRAFDSDNKITVAVKSGKVSVMTKPEVDTNNDEIILTPNQEIVYDKSDKVVARRIVEKPEPIVSQEEVERMRF